MRRFFAVFQGFIGDFMENENNLSPQMTQEEEQQFIEFKRMKKIGEAVGRVAKIECDCLSSYIEKSTLKQLCRESEQIALGGIVVLPLLVKPCVNFLGKDPKVSLVAAISYPHGGDTTAVKAAAVKRAVKDGVDEVEVSAPYALLRDGNYSYFKKECKKLVKAAKGRAVRVVLDGASLSLQELAKSCSAAADGGVHCIRINGATDAEVLTKVKTAVKDKCLIKIDGVENVAGFENAVSLGASLVSCKSSVELARLILAQAQD